MIDTQALDILARLTDAAPVDLDLGPASAAPGGALATAAGVPLSPALWPRGEGWACLGVRVTEPLTDVTALARKLAATAAERGILPVILTTLDQSGFERFGFRVERLSGASEAARMAEEAELAGFWNFALILDARDLIATG
ncbi:MAG TPA: hypothetical protein PLI43_07465 [Albidovulum sp.]|uniref:hypothetical protein n=1 Tax=Albidovulum sp. TaxID=1872424 RepID=UPI002CB65057|nr:hypothetical protein [Albidovulum sp.]